MARVIGEIPQTMSIAEEKLYTFLIHELPDYITIGFRISIGESELDAVLLVPHMGIFILEIKGGSALAYQHGMLYIHDRLGNYRIFRPEQTKRQRYQMVEYMRAYFHINPLVYELNCFPLLKIQEDDLSQMGEMADHFLFLEDFSNSRTFLLKLFKYYTSSVQLGSGNERLENAPLFYDDLDDDTVYEITANWGQTPIERKRPSKPPMIFLSYNRNNQSTAKLIQKELEKKGVFTWKAPMDVPFGENYMVHEMVAIRECAAFVILLSPSAQESNEVKIEFEAAVKNGKKIFPIVLGNFEINTYYLKALREIEWRILENDDLSFLNEIITALKTKHLKKEVEPL